jgi:hypothetical protein
MYIQEKLSYGLQCARYRVLGITFPSQAPSECKEDVRAVRPPWETQWESVAPLGAARGVAGVAPAHAWFVTSTTIHGRRPPAGRGAPSSRRVS